MINRLIDKYLLPCAVVISALFILMIVNKQLGSIWNDPPPVTTEVIQTTVNFACGHGIEHVVQLEQHSSQLSVTCNEGEDQKTIDYIFDS